MNDGRDCGGDWTEESRVDPHGLRPRLGRVRKVQGLPEKLIILKEAGSRTCRQKDWVIASFTAISEDEKKAPSHRRSLLRPAQLQYRPIPDTRIHSVSLLGRKSTHPHFRLGKKLLVST